MRTGPSLCPQALETRKSHERRLREGWYERYCPSTEPGLDIGCSNDPIWESFDQWDLAFGDGDATFMAGLPDSTYQTVYASHVLEHLVAPVLALQNWFRLLRPGGHLIVCVPHRDLYEKQRLLPSRFNGDHKTYWLPDRYDPPCTHSFLDTVRQAFPEGTIVSFRILDDGWVWLPPEVHSSGEYSLEIVVKKMGSEP